MIKLVYFSGSKMNKENNRSAAGLRRSAVAERIRLREEWSALKEIDSQQKIIKNVNKKSHVSKKKTVRTCPLMAPIQETRCRTTATQVSSDILSGVVALVEVGSESRALPLRAALAALGASVLPAWSPLVTHLIWAQGGCRSTRSRARALASRLVSPLWVEACAGAARRLPEQAFPAAARASDLPSPKTLRMLLKKADMENIPIMDLLSDSLEKEQKVPRLRISSDTEQDTSRDTNDTSHDTSLDTSRDTTRDTSRDTTNDSTKNTTAEKSDNSLDIESRVNTAPRRALPKISESISPRPLRSKRKLFTQKEAEMVESSSDETQTKPTQQKVTQKERRELARAERLAKRLLAACSTTERTPADANKNTFRIVLSGMTREERKVAYDMVRALKGKLQAEVDRRTTHVVLGECRRNGDDTVTGPVRARTATSLAGAARGCRVLGARWLRACAAADKWLHHTGYEVPHLKKLARKARVERSALNKQRAEYAYDVFNGMRVALAPDAEQRDAAIKLLKLCGAVIVENPRIRPQRQENQQNTQENQNRSNSQNGPLTLTSILARTQVSQRSVMARNVLPSSQNVTNFTDRDYDIMIGMKDGDVSSRWVFDSVAATRMRTARRYVVNSMSNSDVASQMLVT